MTGNSVTYRPFKRAINVVDEMVLYRHPAEHMAFAFDPAARAIVALGLWQRKSGIGCRRTRSHFDRNSPLLSGPCHI